MRKVYTFILVLLMSVMAACGGNGQVPTDVHTSPYFLSTDKIVNIDGKAVRYRDEGPRSKDTLVMVHGFTSSLETWDQLAAALKGEYRIIRLDLPGHGLTGPDPQGRYTNEDTVLFLKHFLKKINVTAPVVIGNSLGGLVSWRLAAETPKSISKLILIAPGGFSINGVTDKPVAVPFGVQHYLTKAPKASVRFATSALFGDPSKLSEARLEQVREMMLQGNNGEAFVQRAAQFTLPDPRRDFKKVTVPTLIIWGDKDVMIPVAQAQKFKEALPNAQLIIYDNIGHVPQEEAPKRLADDIRHFLTQQE